MKGLSCMSFISMSFICFLSVYHILPLVAVSNKLFKLFLKLNSCIHWFSLVPNTNTSKITDGKNTFYGIMKLIPILIIHKIIDFIIMQYTFFVLLRLCKTLLNSMKRDKSSFLCPMSIIIYHFNLSCKYQTWYRLQRLYN